TGAAVARLSRIASTRSASLASSTMRIRSSARDVGAQQMRTPRAPQSFVMWRYDEAQTPTVGCASRPAWHRSRRGLLGPDIAVQMKGVRGIVLSLHRDEPLVVGPVR